ncbi:hypothetical protein [Inquilinus limosus]|uniref:hypothetical protein n=1 Tax=Inquilinus limosus TaxID=171674 RepID=UPI00068CEE47|nr:hypothetical protein [Inquilinus limosus]
MILRYALCLGLLAVTAAPARAAGPMDVYAIEAANRVGVLEYCRSKQFATADNIEHARRVLNNRPQMPAQAELDKAEALGRQGTVLAAGEQHTLAELAQRSNLDIARMCGSIAASSDLAAGMIK